MLIEQIGNAQSTAMAIKDLNHRFLYANDAFSEASGFSLKALIGKNDLEAGRPKRLVLGDPTTGWPGFWALDNQAIQNISPTINIDTNSGRYRATETLRTPIYNDNREVVALMVHLYDVTEMRELKHRVTNNLDAISKRDGEITAMDSVLATLMACHDTNTLLSQLADVMVEQTRADGAYVSTLQETAEFMEIIAVSGARVQEVLGTTFKQNVGIMGQAWQIGKSVFIDDIDQVDSLFEYKPGTQAFSVPLYVGDILVAALTVTSDPESPDLSKDIPLLERIGGMASIAIANTHLIEGTKRTLKATHALAEVSQMLPKLDDPTTACNVVCRAMLTAVEAARVSSYLIDSEGQLNTHVSWGSLQGKVNRATAMPSSLTKQSIAQWTVDNNKPAFIGRLENDTRETTAVHAARSRMHIGSTYCLPLRKQNKVIGAIQISRSRNQRDFSDTEFDLFNAVVNQLSTSIERLDLANELQHQAFHDQLTSLPNRHKFELELERCIENRNASTNSFSLLFIDLDGFKEVNDSHGHAVGDQLLVRVAERFSSEIRDTDLLARMGGDEFAAILRNDADGLELAGKLLACLEYEFPVSKDLLRVSASIGISRFPDNGNTADLLLQSADEAMYQAKRDGKGCVFTFNESLAVESRNRLKLKQQLRDAIIRKEFRLLYQPQVQCSNNKVVGLEALIRWNHPSRGQIPPCDFIPIAEAAGMINEIGAYVINEAARQLAVWQSSIADHIRVCINIAAPQFQQDDFCDQVLDALKRHSVSPSLLELEVTESIVMQDVSSVVETLNRLRSNGVRIAIDDFGTGYSSLSYLQDLPLDVIKIDQTFINRLCCLLYTSPSPRDRQKSRMPSSA